VEGTGAEQESPKKGGADQGKAELPTESGTDLSFLMTMTWEEAKGLSAQSLEVPPFFRLTADKIDVLKASPDGTARRVRARGKVFIEMQFADSGRVLCQEAYITDDELILRGKPLLQRGGSAIAGLDDATVFYMLGTRLRVIGRHRVSQEQVLLAESQKAATGVSGVGSGSGFAVLGSPPVLPVMSGPWAGGPNPLLPPLSAASVPEEMRVKMRAEAEAVKVMPLEAPQESPAGPPVSLMAPKPTETGPTSPVQELAPLLPVPVKPGS
jgi:hypothetical protein